MEKPINLFSKGPGNLARILSKRPEVYNQLHTLIHTLRAENITSEPIHQGLEETIKTLEEAQRITASSRYYLFSTYDSWAEEQEGRGEGYGLYQLLGEKLEDLLNPLRQRPPTIQETISILRQRKITEIHTFDFEQVSQAYGRQQETRDEDGDFITLSELDEEGKKRLRQAGITIYEQASPFMTSN